MSGLANVAIMAAHAAGKVIMQNFDRLDRLKIQLKENGDYFTNIDLASEQIIIECIQKYYPDHEILSEESGLINHLTSSQDEATMRWIIDPLDGTKNFINGVPHFCVSIAIQKNNEVILGVIHDPFRDETFIAKLNEGTLLNNKRMKITKKNTQANLQSCLIATGLPRKTTTDQENQTDYFLNLALNSSGIRKMGSAALDLAYIGAGRWDAFVDYGLKEWDKSAGILIAKEAGAQIFEFNSKQPNQQYLIAGTENTIKLISKLLSKKSSSTKIQQQ